MDEFLGPGGGGGMEKGEARIVKQDPHQVCAILSCLQDTVMASKVQKIMVSSEKEHGY